MSPCAMTISAPSRTRRRSARALSSSRPPAGRSMPAMARASRSRASTICSASSRARSSAIPTLRPETLQGLGGGRALARRASQPRRHRLQQPPRKRDHRHVRLRAHSCPARRMSTARAAGAAWRWTARYRVGAFTVARQLQLSRRGRATHIRRRAGREVRRPKHSANLIVDGTLARSPRRQPRLCRQADRYRFRPLSGRARDAGRLCAGLAEARLSHHAGDRGLCQDGECLRRRLSGRGGL